MTWHCMQCLLSRWPWPSRLMTRSWLLSRSPLMEKIVRRDEICCGAETRPGVGVTVCRSNENSEKGDFGELIWNSIELFRMTVTNRAIKVFASQWRSTVRPTVNYYGMITKNYGKKDLLSTGKKSWKSLGMTRSRRNIVVVQQAVWPSPALSFVEFGEGLCPSFVSLDNVYWKRLFQITVREAGLFTHKIDTKSLESGRFTTANPSYSCCRVV